MSHQPVVVVTETKSSAATLPRIIGALLMLTIAMIHYLDLGGKLAEVPYLGYLYIALIVGSVLAAALLFSRPRAGWTLGECWHCSPLLPTASTVPSGCLTPWMISVTGVSRSGLRL